MQRTVDEREKAIHQRDHHATSAMQQIIDFSGPACTVCGAIMVPSGACYRCMECGGTSGCS